MVEKRKLAAILAADVAGYSRLAGSDEERTVVRLRALRSDLIDPTMSRSKEPATSGFGTLLPRQNGLLMAHSCHRAGTVARLLVGFKRRLMAAI